MSSVSVVRMTSVRLSFRSEEHTSELQSQSNLVCRLLLEKKKKQITTLVSALKMTSANAYLRTQLRAGSLYGARTVAALHEFYLVRRAVSMRADARLLLPR